MKRSKPLRSRSAGLRTGSALKRKTPLKQVSSSLKQGKPLKTRKRIPLFDDREMRKAWRKQVLARAPVERGVRICPACGKPPTKVNPLEAHHVTSREVIRKYVRSLRLPAPEAAELLARLCWDVRNGIAVCRRDHDLHTRAQKRLPRALVTARNRQFAREILAEFLLDRYYV